MNQLQAWLDSLRKSRSDLAERSLLRELRLHEGRLDFSSNDYLSLNSDGTLAALLMEITREHGDGSFVGSTASRLIRGHYEIFDRAEAEFARFAGAPAALLFTSGYAANAGTIPAVISQRDLVFCDRLCHASLLDGVRLSGARRFYFAHNDLDDLERQLKKHPARSRSRRWIVTESVFSMDGDSPKLPELCDLAERHDALVYLDEAHAVGVRGPGGAGLAAETRTGERIAVNVFPCGKAPGLMGAFVCGAPELKSLLINKARSFVFSTAQPPLLAELLRRVTAHLPQLDDARARLAENAEYLRKHLRAGGYDTGASDAQIVPVIVGDEDSALDLAARCRERGLDIRAIRPPTVPKGSSRLRISLQAGHSREDLDEVIAALNRES